MYMIRLGLCTKLVPINSSLVLDHEHIYNQVHGFMHAYPGRHIPEHQSKKERVSAD